MCGACCASWKADKAGDKAGIRCEGVTPSRSQTCPRRAKTSVLRIVATPRNFISASRGVARVSNSTLSSLAIPLWVAGLAIIGGVINEIYKRHQNRIAVAAAMHAEISALVEITTANNTVQEWTKIAAILVAGNNIPIPPIFVPEPTEGPVFNAYVNKFGFLAPNDAKDIILFYQNLIGIRILLRNLVSGAWEASPNAAAIKAIQVQTGLQFWQQCATITQRLLPSLAKTANRSWFSWCPTPHKNPCPTPTPLA